MNCREFEEILPLLAGDDLPPKVLQTAEIHASSCKRCGRLLAAAREEAGAGGAPGYLTRSILKRTSGTVCPAIEDRLVDFADDALAGVDLDLVAGHLLHCEGCSDMVAALEVLRQDLPALAEVQPDSRFVLDVLERTTRARPARRPGIADHLLAGWSKLARRPRVALELAYCGAALIFILGGSPESLVRRTAAREAMAPFQGGAALLADLLRAEWLEELSGTFSGESPSALTAGERGTRLARTSAEVSSRLRRAGRTLDLTAAYALPVCRAALRWDAVELWRTWRTYTSEMRRCWVGPGADPGAAETEPSERSVRNSEQDAGVESPGP
ncbi:MAG: zf-HC2 domain-containing protein [Candidatus Eisenbacteria bacterium]|nr:zf-HC2 domain-containing protein [Candidatus Eisenbacteria bacterium]